MVYLVFSKGGREGGVLPGKKSFNLERNAKPNHGMIIPPPREFVGRLFVCLLVFQNHCNCPTVEAGGQGFIQRPHGGAENKCANARPRDNSKIEFYCHLWLRPKLQQC